MHEGEQVSLKEFPGLGDVEESSEWETSLEV